ncbi:microtubule-associated protein futsch-like [Durio zibethinus]|uniref:Microtubule-associated protein futsch-like n=1 Tax=Durio zibethinus TaxID=66656 RepID=A0A6P5Y9D0_DURZI|nr:microtubule-associated protein futsch-like [Durio zibethinus]XP_022737065.1 microtubule-associated protein futsch-like [Durio zibethinus]
MEEPVKEQQPPAQNSGSAGKSKLRYPLRSSIKPKEEKPRVGDLSSSSSSRRGRATPSVSKSVGVLDLSKEKSAKPPRRLSIPTKSTLAPSPKFVGTITPISEARAKKPANGQGKSDTPLSDASRSATRRRFNVLSSASYWLSQIKLSESSSKHSVSLGFFKLGLEAGCEPLKKMHDELKSYIRRHNLSENGEAIKELLESYNVSENSDQPQVSENCSQVPEEGTRSSDDEVHSVSSAVGFRKLKPKSLNTDAAQVSSVAESAKEATLKNNPATRNRVLNRNGSNSRSVSETRSRMLQKTQKTTKPEDVKGKDKTKRLGTESTNEEGQISPTAAVETVDGDKENMDGPLTEEINLSGVM